MARPSPAPNVRPAARTSSVFVARQPIFDRSHRVFGYELLFRSGLDNVCPETDGDEATLSVISSSLMVFRLEELTGGRPAFVNFTRDALLDGHARAWPADRIIVEILETVEPDENVLSACQDLKRAGYRLALDDVFCDEQLEGFLGVADIIKVDVQAADAPTQARLRRIAAGRRKRCLAEKVETREGMEAALAVGYDYFQGYFFSRPVVLVGRDVPITQLHSLQVLKDSLRSDLDTRRFEAIIKRDAALAYKLLRYINAPAFAIRHKVHSIKHALDLLGIESVQRWLCLVLLNEMAGPRLQELIVLATVRARFCEQLADKVRMSDRSQDLFLIGLLSLLDALVGKPMDDLVAMLPLADDLAEALLGKRNRLRDILEIVLAYERGNWAELPARIGSHPLTGEELPAVYHEALRWADALAAVEASTGYAR